MQMRMLSNSLAVQGSGPVWMDKVSCHDQATALAECSFDGWRVHDYSHGEDVAVKCGKIKHLNSIESFFSKANMCVVS